MQEPEGMPKGPNGQKQPADSIGCTVMAGKIATGEIDEDGYVVPGHKDSGLSGGLGRAKSLSAERRKEIAKSAAARRWGKEETMNSQVQRMSAAMFPPEGAQVVNVKFFLGTSRAVTAEELADQLDRADAQLRSGTAARTMRLDGDLTTKHF
jgi:hypothetical protein